MPKPQPDRRSVLAIAGSAALLALAGPAGAETPGTPMIRGTISFAGNAPIPKGELRITLGTPGADAARPAAELVTDGTATAVDFALASPDPEARDLQVVARLEREDGWLLARGSAPAEAGHPVRVTLHTVMY